MGGFETVIANRSAAGDADVHDGCPTLKFVVVVAMEKISGADGHASGAGFDEGKTGVIVDGVVGQKNFLAAAAAHVERREVVEGAGGSDTGKKQIVFAIPETMFARTEIVFRSGSRDSLGGGVRKRRRKALLGVKIVRTAGENQEYR